MLAGASLWGVSWYPMRLLEEAGLRNVWLTLLLHGTIFLVTLPWTARGLSAPIDRRGWMATLVVGAAWSDIAFIVAVLHGSVLRMMLLFYVSPLWGTLAGAVLLGERPSRRELGSLGLSMLGALVTLWDPEIGAPWPRDTADWLSLSAGFAFAVSNTAGRKLEDMPIATKSAAIWLMGMGMSALAIVWLRPPAPQLDIPILLGVVALAVGGLLGMTALLQYGAAHLPVHRSSVLALFELAVAAVSERLLTSTPLVPKEWLGAALIALGAYVSTRNTSQETAAT
jgi:drug/metabolite transporter (DMT)-like permease